MNYTKEQWSTLCDGALQELREGKHVPEVISLFNPTRDDEKTKIKIAYAVAVLEKNPEILGLLLLSKIMNLTKNVFSNGQLTENLNAN